MILHQRNGVIGSEHPVLQRSGGKGPSRRATELRFVLKQRQGRGIQQLARTQLLQFLFEARVSVGALKLGGAKFAGGKIQRGKASGVLRDTDRR